MPDKIVLSEVFGPTIQGEGPDIGRPCLFIRFQGCPVKCPGCDTAYSWDGTEHGTPTTLPALDAWVRHTLVDHPQCGLVITGGEPLIHWRNQGLVALLRSWAGFRVPAGTRRWLALETSGYIGGKKIIGWSTREGALSQYEAASDFDRFWDFLRVFSTVTVSPKVTPSLLGKPPHEDLVANLSTIMDSFPTVGRAGLVFKFVAADASDVAAVIRLDTALGITQRGFPIYLMPFGTEREEILAVCMRLLPAITATGYTLSPRLHSLLWGKKRGV